MINNQSQSQRMRKNVSPGAATKQGPLRATVPVSLMQTSSPISPSKSPPLNLSGDSNKVKTRLSPDNRVRVSPETQATSMGCRGEQSKVSKSSPGPYIRRTASVDTIYLLGQWQRDALYLSYCGRLMMDRATQTPDEFDDSDKKLIQKRCGSTCGEALEMKFIRQRLQRSNHPPRMVSSPSGSHQRQSPLPGDHSVISSTGGTLSPTQPSTSPLLLQQQGAPSSVGSSSSNAGATYSSFTLGSSHAIPIPDIPKPLIPRMRSSVEGLNQEIEKIVLRQVGYYEGDDVLQKREPTPEGHRAPIADLFRHTQSVDTQTPFDHSDGYMSSNSSSGSQSVSPAVPLMLGQMDTSRPSSPDENKSSSDLETNNKVATSPHINKFLTREPPDGCEKVKIEEIRNSMDREISEYSCPKPSMNFVLLPSRRSAFYPLCKNCGMSAPNGELLKSSTPPAS